MSAGALSLFGSAVNAWAGVHANDDTNNTNIRLQREANLFNRDLWREQMEYNLPINQVKRLKESGLNPALAMSQSGLVDAGNASSPSPAGAATVIPWVPNIDFSGAENIMLNEQLNKSAIDLNKANAEEARSRIPVHQKESQVKQEQLNNLVESTKKLGEEVKSIIESTALTKAQRASTELSTLNQCLMTQSQLANDMKQRALTSAQTKATEAEERAVNENIRLTRATLFKILADTELIKANAQLIRQQVVKGHRELATTYGTTETEIESTLTRMFQTNKNKLERMFKTSAWQKADSYTRLEMINAYVDEALHPIREASAFASGVVSGAASVVK